MNKLPLPRSFDIGWLAVFACLLCSSRVAALTPESPQVKAAVAKGLAYLASTAANDEKRVGGEALMGMAFAKTDAPPTHPRIQQALKSIRENLRMTGVEGEFNGSEQIYHLGLTLVFLASTDGKAYRAEIDQLLARLLTLQKQTGGWGYPSSQLGDTSMTQYGVLGLWESYRSGANPPLQSWEAVANWLLRTQDPSGGFGYQGTESMGPNLVQQNDVRPSLAAAGLGSVYVCMDQFGVDRKAVDQGPKLPSGLKPVKKAETRGKQRPNNVDLTRLRNATTLGNRWFDTNFTTDPPQWDYYYYYAFERYRSFRDLVDGLNESEPKWYTDIATILLKTQSPDGSWGGESGVVVDTSFSILFLVRSTKKSIQKALGEGTLVGGKGLPKDTSNVLVKAGNIVARPLSGPADELLAVMDDPNHPDFQKALDAFSQKTELDSALLPRHLVKLRQLAGGDSPEGRMAAVRGLARSRDLDTVPVLLFALNDADWRVVQEAHDGLRFISRRFNGGGIETVDSEKARADAKKIWLAWFRSIRPNADLAD